MALNPAHLSLHFISHQESLRSYQIQVTKQFTSTGQQQLFIDKSISRCFPSVMLGWQSMILNTNVRVIIIRLLVHHAPRTTQSSSTTERLLMPPSLTNQLRSRLHNLSRCTIAIQKYLEDMITANGTVFSYCQCRCLCSSIGSRTSSA